MSSDLVAKGQGIIAYQSTLTGKVPLQWMDKRPMTMQSTVHTRVTVKLPPNQHGLERSKAKVVVDYKVGIKRA